VESSRKRRKDQIKRYNWRRSTLRETGRSWSELRVFSGRLEQMEKAWRRLMLLMKLEMMMMMMIIIIIMIIMYMGMENHRSR
jgi:hypothetical protein